MFTAVILIVALILRASKIKFDLLKRIRTIQRLPSLREVCASKIHEIFLLGPEVILYRLIFNRLPTNS
jgi:hypothetical protein